MHNLTQALAAPPTHGDPLEARAAWYTGRDSRDGQAASEYFVEYIMPELAQRRRHMLPEDLQSWHPSHFITITSHSAELAPLGWELLGRPRQCLLLYTPANGAMVRAKDRQLKWMCGAAMPREIVDTPAMLAEIKDHVARFLDSAPPGPAAFDLTPGQRLMTIALINAAPEGSRFLYLHHELDQRTRRVEPLSITPLIWEKRAGGPLILLFAGTGQTI